LPYINPYKRETFSIDMPVDVKKPHINLIFIGHVDHGKSTVLGRLFFETGRINERQLEEFRKLAQEYKKAGWEYAFAVDRTIEERKRGLTIDLWHGDFETNKYFFTIIDAPGHRDFIKNMITGASQADAAILVVSAKRNEFEAGMGAGGQTREHALLAKYLAQVNQFIVLINKMDAVNYDQNVFNEEKEQVEKMLKRWGIKIIATIPVSGLKGDNIAKKSPNMPWYTGPTLVEALDMLEPPSLPIDKPLRIPIQDVYSISGIGTVPVGKVITGKLKVGDTVIFMPPGIKAEVKSIETHHTPIQEAKPGDNIGFCVKGVARKDIKRGYVVGHPDNPPTVAEKIVAQIFVVWHPTQIMPGYCPVMHVHTAHAPVMLERILAKIDPRSGQVIKEFEEGKEEPLKPGDAAKVVLKPLKPIVIEPVDKLPQLARFAIRDMGKTVAVGVALEVTPAKTA